MAAAKADPVMVARKSFNNCMIEAHNKAITDRIPISDFTKESETACPEQRKAFFDLVVRAEKQYSSQKDAEDYAKEEVQLVVDAKVAAYSENFEKKATMAPES